MLLFIWYDMRRYIGLLRRTRAAQRIATILEQNPEIGPFLPSENRFSDPPGPVSLHPQS